MEKINCKLYGTLQGGKWDKTQEKSRRVYSTDGLSPTLTTCGGVIKMRIRKLTPKECFRLMDFDDEDFEKAAKEILTASYISKQAIQS